MSYRDTILGNCPDYSIDNLDNNLSLAGLGLGGEAGEVIDIIKKYLHHNKPLDRDKLIKEMGDVRWYLEYLAASINVTMEEVERINIEKVLKRYPNGFSFEAANAERVEE